MLLSAVLRGKADKPREEERVRESIHSLDGIPINFEDEQHRIKGIQMNGNKIGALSQSKVGAV